MRFLVSMHDFEWGANLRLIFIVLSGIVLAAGWALLRSGGSFRSRLTAGLAVAALPALMAWPRLGRRLAPTRRPIPGLATGSLESLDQLRRIGAL